MKRAIPFIVGLTPPIAAVVGLIWPDTQFAVTVIVVGTLLGFLGAAVAHVIVSD